jgi:hypothetical protein
VDKPAGHSRNPAWERSWIEGAFNDEGEPMTLHGMVADSWGNSANGAICQQSAWNGGNNQQWRLNSVGNGRNQIINRGTGTALDNLGNSTPGSNTAMWAPNNSANNHWTIAPV